MRINLKLTEVKADGQSKQDHEIQLGTIKMPLIVQENIESIDVYPTTLYKALKNEIEEKIGPAADEQILKILTIFEPNDNQEIGKHLSDGDTIDVYYWPDDGEEATIRRSDQNLNITVIVKKDGELKIVPWKQPTEIVLKPNNFFSLAQNEKFGLIIRTLAVDGKMTYNCNIYKVKDTAEIMIEKMENMIVVHDNNTRLESLKTETFTEDDLIEIFLAQRNSIAAKEQILEIFRPRASSEEKENRQLELVKAFFAMIGQDEPGDNIANQNQESQELGQGGQLEMEQEREEAQASPE